LINKGQKATIIELFVPGGLFLFFNRLNSQGFYRKMPKTVTKTSYDTGNIYVL
jgi:hypothetical protein